MNWLHMNALLSNPRDPFKGIRPQQISFVLQLLHESSLRTLDFIQRKYEEKFINFHETLIFMESLNLVKKVDEALEIMSMEVTPGELCADARKFNRFILRLITISQNLYSQAIHAYLKTFRIEGKQCIRDAMPSDISMVADTRNFLMDISAIRLIHGTNRYILDGGFLDIFLAAHSNGKGISPEALEQSLKRLDEFGSLAEEHVLAYEKSVVGPDLVDKVQHVALRDVTLGYDILSVRKTETINLSQRFIEVKAVSSRDHRFFWTPNEVTTAKILREHYYLYLLPFEKKTFKIDGLMMIKDPYLEVIEKGAEWAVRKNTIECRRRN